MKTSEQKSFSSPSGLCDSTASLHLECMRSSSALAFALCPSPAGVARPSGGPATAVEQGSPPGGAELVLGASHAHSSTLKCRECEIKQTTHIQKTTRKGELARRLHKSCRISYGKSILKKTKNNMLVKIKVQNIQQTKLSKINFQMEKPARLFSYFFS